MDPELQAQRDTAAENLEASAEIYGYANAAELLASDVGRGADLDDYCHFLNLYYTGSMYFSDTCEKLAPTDEEVEAYFTENEEAYASSGLTRDNKSVDVRHVLSMPEGATSENIRTETFDEAAWEASRQKAAALLEQWEKGDKSEDTFAAMAMEHSQDGSASSGGLYTGVTEGQMVQAFNDWRFDDIRQPGDYGLVKTEFGYHLMFFVDSTPIYKESAKSDLINAQANQILNDILAKYPVEAEFDKILLGYVELDSGETETETEAVAEQIPGDSNVWIIAGVSLAILAVAAFVFWRKEEEI